jgi:hypothetical protein
LDNDEESYVSVEQPTRVEEDFHNEYDYEDEEDFLSVVRDKFSGIPKTIRMLHTFYNPRPHDEREYGRGEAAFYKRAVKVQEAALIATVYDGSLEPKDYAETKNANYSQTGGELCVLSSTIWNKTKFWRSFLKLKYQWAETLLGHAGY